MKNIQNFIREFEKSGNKIIYISITGSKLYGTNNENSDTDYKGIFIPSKESLLTKTDISSYSYNSNPSNTKNSKTDIDITLHSIHKFLSQVSKSETGAIDLLYSMFSDKVIYEKEKYTSIIKKNIDVLKNKNMKSFIGYALGQTKKHGIKGARYKELNNFVGYIEGLDAGDNVMLSEVKSIIQEYISNEKMKYIKYKYAAGPQNSLDNEILYLDVLGKLWAPNIKLSYFKDRVNELYNQFGNRTKTIAQTKDKIDYKALSHSYRIASEVKELLLTDKIAFPLKEREYIKQIKSGLVGIEEVIDKVENILNEVDELLLNSKLPEQIEDEIIKKLILQFYR